MILLRTLLAETTLNTDEVRNTVKQRATQQGEVLKMDLESAAARAKKSVAVGKIESSVSMDDKETQASYKMIANIVVNHSDNKAMAIEKAGRVIAKIGSSGLPEFHQVVDQYIAKMGGKEVWREKAGNRAGANILYKMFNDLRSSNTLSKDEKIVLPTGPKRPAMGNAQASGPQDSTVAGGFSGVGGA